MDSPENEPKSPGSPALQNAQTILIAGDRAEAQLVQAVKALEAKTRELAQQREWLEVTLASIGDAVITTDLKTRIIFLNPAAERMTGWKLSEAKDQPLDVVFKIIHEGTREAAPNPIQEALQTGKVVGLANHTALVARDGKEIAVEDSAAPIRDAEGKICGAVMVFHDVSERRSAEMALKVSHDQFSAIIDNSPLRVLLVDSDLRLRHLNTKAQKSFADVKEILGQELAQLTGSLWSPAAAEQVVERFRHTLKTGEPFFERGFTRVRVLEIQEHYDWEIHRVTLPDGQQGVTCYFTDISEHMLAQQALQESENRKSAILSASLDAIITLDHDGKISDFNPAAEKIFGYTSDELLGKPLADLVKGLPPYVAMGEGPVITRRIEMPALHADQHEFPVELSIARIAETKPPMFTATLRDITERKQTEQALTERARLAALRADISMALARNEDFPTVLQHCCEALVNHLDGAFARIWTLNEGEEVLELRASAGLYTHLHGPHGRIKIGEYKIGRIAQSREPLLTNNVPNDSNISDPDWARREGMVAFVGYPLILEEQVLGVMAMFARHTLSENMLAELGPIADGLAQWVRRRRAEEELRRSEEELRALADSIPQLAWIAEPDGFLSWYNRRYYAYTGTTAAEMTGWGWKAVHDPEMLPMVAERWGESLRTGVPFEMEFPIRGADGTFRWFLTRANPVRDSEGRIVRWFGTNTDMEEVKRAQEALSKARKELQDHAASLEQTIAERTAQLSEKIGELEAFSYSISHDMRSPLRAMNGYSVLLLEEHRQNLDEEAQHYLERIHKAASRMDLLIQEVLTYSKVTKAELTLRPTDLERLIAEVCQGYPAFQAPEAIITVKGSLPRVLGHETFLTQIISNLLGNAVKFVKPGVIPKVTIYSETHEGMVTVWFEDNGIGIDPMHFKRIFEIFGRVYAETIFEGTGIGLAIARKAIERMNGTMGVESQPDVGSRFWFSLKRAD